MPLKLEHSKSSLSLERSGNIQVEATSVHDSTSKIPKIDTAYELHPLPTQLHERSRRLSAPAPHFDKKFCLGGGDDCLQTIRSAHDAPSSNIYATGTPISHEQKEINTLSKQQKRYSLVQFAAICLSFWLVGWNDGSLGPLLPRIQHNYRLGYSIVSMIFVGNCAGYVTGSALNVWFNERYGLGKVVVAGALIQLVGYGILISTPPFPLIICSYFFLGFGISLQVAQGNGFIGSLRQHMTLKLGLVHGAYGLGAFTSPFSATYFSALTDRKWAFHFILSAAFSIVNTMVLICVFRFRWREDILRDAGQEPYTENTTQPEGNTYRQILKLKAMPWLTIFALIYIGVEVTLGGWMVSFIIRERHGGSSSGYISSGFFGGLTAGRVCLIWLNNMIGSRRIIFIYTVIAIGLELTVWFVPSIIENGIAISMIGLVLGPMYPLLVSHMTHILPHWLLTGCIGLVTGLGMAGSAALPFVTGLLASKFGIGSLQPLMISMMGCMIFVWALVPGAN